MVQTSSVFMAQAKYRQDYSRLEIYSIIQQLKTLKVHNAAASHCTGDRARELFARQYKGHFTPLGAGAVIMPVDLK